MYFLEQVKRQFLMNITVHNVPEGPVEAEQPSQAKTPETPVGASDVLDHATNTTSNLDSQVATEESRGLLQPSEPLSFGSEVPSGNIDTSGFNLDGVELSESAPVAVGNGPRDEYSMGERVSSPEEVALLGKLESGEIGMDDPEITALVEELGMDDFMRTAGIDGLEPGEIPEGIEESTPEMLEGSRTDIQGELDAINSQIVSLPEGSQERQNLERRAGLLGGFIDAIESALNGEQSGLDGGAGGFNGVDIDGNHNVLASAQKHMGITEESGHADKFLMGIARSARETPWCAGFVSYVCQQAGYNVKPTLSSTAFVNGGTPNGKGHVAFYAGDNQIIGGNQGQNSETKGKVSVSSMSGRNMKGWIMPEEYASGKPPHNEGKPPIGAIVVFGRGRNS